MSRTTGRIGTGALLKITADAKDGRVPSAGRGILDVLARQYSALGAEIGSIDRSIVAWHRSCEASRRLEEIPGIGPIVATALVAEIGDWKAFGSGRSLAAWIGLVPRQQSTGGKDKLGSITKQGNRYLRWLLVAGAMAVIRYAQKHGTLKRPWLGRLMARRPTKVAAVALANKMARMAGPSSSMAIDIGNRSHCWRRESGLQKTGNTNWRGHDDVMQIRSFRGSGEPVWVSALPSAGARLGSDPRRALGPAAAPAASTGRTRDRTRPMLQLRQKVLARAPSTRDPERS